MIFFLLESVWHGAVAFESRWVNMEQKRKKRHLKKGFVLLKKG
jgi:pyoverdine/dityrosine biosynthesis protein Dit1